MIVNHAQKFEMVRRFYNTFYNGERLWSIEKVRNAVVKGWISAEEFSEITKEAYNHGAE